MTPLLKTLTKVGVFRIVRFQTYPFAAITSVAFCGSVADDSKVVEYKI